MIAKNVLFRCHEEGEKPRQLELPFASSMAS
jgi:hypothetical protein